MTNNKITLCIIDDDKDNLFILKHMLEKPAYNGNTFDSHLFFDPFEAWEFLEENEVDLVILDSMIPGLSGKEIINKMAHHKRLRNTPIILQSGQIHSMEEEHFPGVDCFLLKPFTHEELIEAIREVIEV